MLERLGKALVQKLLFFVFRYSPNSSPDRNEFFVISSEVFAIEPEREPFRLIPPLYPEVLEKHGPTRLYSASEAASPVIGLKRSQTTCTNGVVWLCSSGAFSDNIVRYSPEFVEWAFSEVGFPLYGVLGSSLPASNAQATPKIAHLSDTSAPIRQYATPVIDKGTL